MVYYFILETKMEKYVKKWKIYFFSNDLMDYSNKTNIGRVKKVDLLDSSFSSTF